MLLPVHHVASFMSRIVSFQKRPPENSLFFSTVEKYRDFLVWGPKKSKPHPEKSLIFSTVEKISDFFCWGRRKLATEKKKPLLKNNRFFPLWKKSVIFSAGVEENWLPKKKPLLKNNRFFPLWKKTITILSRLITVLTKLNVHFLSH